MDDHAMLLAFIQEAVREGNFYFTGHGVDKHTGKEQFRPIHAVEAILNGQIIEVRDDESRCLICGEVNGLPQSPEYITNYLHCVCEYDNIQNIVIVTMYRPNSDDWINQHTRRRK